MSMMKENLIFWKSRNQSSLVNRFFLPLSCCSRELRLFPFSSYYNMPCERLQPCVCVIPNMGQRNLAKQSTYLILNGIIFTREGVQLPLPNKGYADETRPKIILFFFCYIFAIVSSSLQSVGKFPNVDIQF